MTAVAFDTLAFGKKLRGQFTTEQAETLAEAFASGANEQPATKTDLKELELRIEIKLAETVNRTILWTVGSIFSSAALIIALGKLIP